MGDELEQLAAVNEARQRVVTRRRGRPGGSPIVYVGATPGQASSPFAAGFFGALGVMAAVVAVAAVAVWLAVAATPRPPASPSPAPRAEERPQGGRSLFEEEDRRPIYHRSSR